MCALWIEESEVCWVVGLKPETLPSGLKFDEAGLVVRAVYRAHVVLRDSEALENRGFRPAALCHDDIWTQDSQFSGNEAAAVLE